MNTPKNSIMFNFRIDLSLWRQLREAVKERGYFSIASFLREAIREKINREVTNGR